MLTDDDWLDVAGFAFAHRPLLAVVGSLNRLLHTGLPLPALRASATPG
jgi:tRNA(Met) cytidine acetyltransferase